MQKNIMQYLNKLEGFKAAIKNIHWSSKKMPEHEYMDDFEDLVSSHQDYVAEIAQGIFGKIKNNELKAVHYTIKTPQKLMKDVLKAAENFYATIQKQKKFIGLRSVMEDFMAKINQGTYMLDMALIENVVNKSLNMIKESKDINPNKKVVRLTESKLKQMIAESVCQFLRESEELDTVQNQQTKEPIPSWALNYLINGDVDDLSDDEIAEIDNWMEEAQIYEVCVPEGEEYFCRYPAFGKPCGVYDCVCFCR